MARAERIGSTGSTLGPMAFLAIFTLALLFVQAAWAQEQYQLDQGQWQKQTQYDPSTPEGQLQTIRKLLAQGQAKKASKLAKAWQKQYPNHPMLVDAYMLRGDARVAYKRYYKALYDYEQVIRLYPGTEQFITALERELEIANLYGHGMRRHFLGMRVVSAYDEAEEIFIRIQERAPGSELGEKAMLALADMYYRRAQMNSAADAYDLFLINYPRSQHREYAMLRLIQANLATFKGPRFDSTGLIEASQRLQMYQKEFPAAAERIGADAMLVRIDESLALKLYHTARWYDRRNDDHSGVYMYRRVVTDHPRTAAAQLAMDRLGHLQATPVAPRESSLAQPVKPTVQEGTAVPLATDPVSPTTAPASPTTAPSPEGRP